MCMSFKFDSQKTVEAAAIFLKLNDGSMKYMALIKLLYVVDRIALDRFGEPVTGDHYVSMDRGPVLSKVLDFIHYGPSENSEPWFEYISSPENYGVKLLKDPGTGELCEAEEDLIQEVYQDYGKLDRFYLAKLTHKIFPEWQDPSGSAIPIRMNDILTALGKTDKEIHEIQENRKQQEYLDLLLDNGHS
ncbi:hypothetical protein THII_2591 [Thioploca ingrica]|uniref:Antitoxin SocA-like Panacea domain-containing protein n=1 Tax=Thioploca ingrica TaxID=40754 RepID=A0A090AFJ3_9GAMM|nr:hypothetical protein THII_2591 [Thioploca ingrica]